MLPKPTNTISHSCKISSLYQPIQPLANPLSTIPVQYMLNLHRLSPMITFSLPVNQMPNVSRSDAVATLYKWYSFRWIDTVNWLHKHCCLCWVKMILGLWERFGYFWDEVVSRSVSYGSRRRPWAFCFRPLHNSQTGPTRWPPSGVHHNFFRVGLLCSTQRKNEKKRK